MGLSITFIQMVEMQTTKLKVEYSSELTVYIFITKFISSS
jgi:hypothetical protein